MTTESITTTKTPTAGTWAVDPSHSELTITARHLMVSKVRGSFEDITASIVVAENPAESNVRVVAKTASVATGSADRDEHLRSPDFLDAGNHPEIVFQSTDLVRGDEGWLLTGDLTIRDVTKPVTFRLSFAGEVVDPFGNTKAIFGVSGEIDREEWGLTWNVPLEGGGVLVSKTFKVEYEVQAVLQS